MTSTERLARLAAPTGRRVTSRSRLPQLGDGDRCPLDSTHGSMFVQRAVAGREPRQYCPHVSHDGVSRAFWPFDTTPEALAEMAWG